MSFNCFVLVTCGHTWRDYPVVANTPQAHIKVRGFVIKCQRPTELIQEPRSTVRFWILLVI